MTGTNPPTSVGGPPSAAAIARAAPGTQALKQSVQAAFEGTFYAIDFDRLSYDLFPALRLSLYNTSTNLYLTLFYSLPDNTISNFYSRPFSHSEVEAPESKKMPSSGYTSKVRVEDRYNVVGFIRYVAGNADLLNY